jgi:ketosteroid isomerase-like protein
MPRHLRLLALAVALLVPPLAAQQSTDMASLRRVDSLWASTYASHDTTTALAIMHPDFFMTGVSGRLKDRATELGDIRKSPGFEVPWFRSEDVHARVLGDAAYTAGTLTWELRRSDGNASTYRFRYTAVWQRGGDEGWQLMALHMGQAQGG